MLKLSAYLIRLRIVHWILINHFFQWLNFLRRSRASDRP